MPVDREKALGASLGERESGWEVDDDQAAKPAPSSAAFSASEPSTDDLSQPQTDPDRG